jgi:hypothetical protein
MTLDGIIPVLSWIGALTGIPGLVVAVYNARAKAQSDQRLHQQAQDIERLKSEYRQLESKSQVEHGWLYQRRAQAVVELFELVVDADMKIARLVQTIAHRRPDEETQRQLFQDAEAASIALLLGFRKAAIFFPADVNTKFEQLDLLFLKKSISASVYREPKTRQDYEALFRASEWNDVRALIDELKVRLQRLLGDVAG